MGSADPGRPQYSFIFQMKRLVVSILFAVILCSTAFAKAGDSSVYTAKQTDYSLFSIKTNLLYDAVLIPNLGLEVNVYDNWTIYGDLMYADWNMPSKHFYWNLFGTQFGVRKYFGQMASQRSLSGHHAGIYGQALAYDLQNGNLGQQTANINFAAGVEYGYSLPIARNLNLDFEIGVGYLTGKYYEYVAHEDHYTWLATVSRAWFGPTKASVSFVWLIQPFKKFNR